MLGLLWVFGWAVTIFKDPSVNVGTSFPTSFGWHLTDRKSDDKCPPQAIYSERGRLLTIQIFLYFAYYTSVWYWGANNRYNLYFVWNMDWFVILGVQSLALALHMTIFDASKVG